MAELRQELGREEVEAAERGFLRLLRRKRFSPAFIDRHAADLLARARLEYSRFLANGGEAENPVGWIIHCAWRRTQNQLEQEDKEPKVVSIDAGGAFASDSVTPEEEALRSDRFRRLQEAIARLPVEERKVIALTYYEGMSVRQVGRTLKWDKCKADRRHHAALERLRDLLGVTDVDSLQVEIGIVAWGSLVGGGELAARMPTRADGITESAANGLTAILSRGHDLARRLLTGGPAEPGMAPALGGAGRAAGACGAAVVACLASGVIGPGVGGVDVLADRPRERPVKEQPSPERKPPAPPAAPLEVTTTPPVVEEVETNADAESSGRKTSKKTVKRKEKQKRTTPSPATSQQVAEEFDPFTGASEGSSGGASVSGGSTSSQSSGSGGGSSSPPPASGKQVESEFGL
ncbi:MAG: sigma-70 family RNA polymerase sigma factor [Gemmatimonadales bacterium]